MRQGRSEWGRSQSRSGHPLPPLLAPQASQVRAQSFGQKSYCHSNLRGASCLVHRLPQSRVCSDSVNTCIRVPAYTFTHLRSRNTHVQGLGTQSFTLSSRSGFFPASLGRGKRDCGGGDRMENSNNLGMPGTFFWSSG